MNGWRYECGNCGRALGHKATICSSCGARIAGIRYPWFANPLAVLVVAVLIFGALWVLSYFWLNYGETTLRNREVVKHSREFCEFVKARAATLRITFPESLYENVAMNPRGSHLIPIKQSEDGEAIYQVCEIDLPVKWMPPGGGGDSLYKPRIFGHLRSPHCPGEALLLIPLMASRGISISSEGDVTYENPTTWKRLYSDIASWMTAEFGPRKPPSERVTLTRLGGVDSVFRFGRSQVSLSPTCRSVITLRTSRNWDSGTIAEPPPSPGRR
jgi:hypothetical protein